MIDWDTESWGGTVHIGANGSWVPDRHTGDGDAPDRGSS